MPDLYLQRRLAAEVAGVGLNNVKLPPDYLDEIRDALTREDVRKLIEEGKIIIEKKRGISTSRTKTRRKTGDLREKEGRAEAKRAGRTHVPSKGKCGLRGSER